MSPTVVSPKLWRYMRLMFKFGNIFHSHPYQWNKGLNRGELCSSKWSLGVWYTNVGITAVYSAFVAGRTIQISFDQESSNIEKVYIKFVLFWLAAPALFQTVLLAKKNDLALFCHLNSTAVRVFEEHISNQDVEQTNKEKSRSPPKCLIPKIVDLFFDLLWYGILGTLTPIGMLNCVRPESPEFISSFLAPSSGLARWPVILLSAVFHTYYVYTYAANVILLMYLALGSGIPAIIALVQIRGWLEIELKRRSTIPEPRVQRILDMYKSVQIVMKAYEDCLCDILVPVGKTLLMSMIVYCSYGAIRMGGFLAAFLGFIGTSAFCILIPTISMIAKFDTVSKEILELMQEPGFQNSCTPGQKKEVKSLHPVQLSMGGVYILDKECVKTICRIIVDRTVDILLASG